MNKYVYILRRPPGAASGESVRAIERKNVEGAGGIAAMGSRSGRSLPAIPGVPD
jgi:hypothetical protein